MNNCKLFLSHSSQDKEIVNAFVNFMYKIGLTEENMVCTSSPGTKIAIGEDIYEYLNNLLSEDEVYVIYFMSDNYYSSPVCLNEMGAVWLKKSQNLNLLLPGFEFDDIQGVVGKDKVGIKLGTCDDLTKASFNEFKDKLEQIFNISIPFTRWEIARDEFLNASIENSRKFNMSFSQSYCIGDLENDGCKIIRKLSNYNKITANVNFDETDSKLCSIVVFNEKRNMSNLFINKKNLCFEAYADVGINCMDIEICLNGINMSFDIYLDEDEKIFKIPLTQFCDSLSPWKNVSEIKFILHRKKVTKPSQITIKNLRLE